MTSAAGEDEHDRKLLQLRACQRCGHFEEAAPPIQRCARCGFDYGADTPRLPAWPWRWWYANIAQTIASVLAALNLAWGAISLAMLANPIGSFAAAALFALPVIDLKRRRRKAPGETERWIALCPGGLVAGRGNFALMAQSWSAYEAHVMQRLAPGRWRLQFVAGWRKTDPAPGVDVELMLGDEEAEAMDRWIAEQLEATRTTAREG